MLVLEIAAGIVLGVLVLRFFGALLPIAVWIVLLAAAAVVFLLLKS